MPLQSAREMEDNGLCPNELLPSRDSGVAQPEKNMLLHVSDSRINLGDSSCAATVQNSRLSADDFWGSSDQDLGGDFPRSSDTFSCLSEFEVSRVAMHDIPNMPFYSSFFSPWESPDGSVQGPALTSTQPSHVPSGETTSNSQDIRQLALDDDGFVIADALSSRIDSLMATASLSDEDVRDFKTYYSFLWATFVRQIGPFLTPFGRRADNPILKHLVPNAERSNTLLVAVLYLTQIIVGRKRKEPPSPKHRFLEEKVNEVLQGLDESAPGSYTGRSNSGVPAEQRNLLLTLSIILVLCMAFMANQDTTKLISHIEYAVVLCQALFKTHADDDGFLYLAKLLGFIQISLLFTKGADSINAPDYLSAALELQNDIHGSGLNVHTHIHFRDLDMFSGLSSSVASIIYAVGTLARRKRAGIHDSSISYDGVAGARAFECEIDGLETRLRRHATILTRHREESSDFTANTPSESRQSSGLMRDLDLLNEAVFWASWTIFFTDFRCRSEATDPDLATTSERILDCCAEVPRDSPAAPLVLFPLMVGGLRSTKKVYREFVLTRLESLDNMGLSDTGALRRDLTEHWWTPGALADSPTSFSNFVL